MNFGNQETRPTDPSQDRASAAREERRRALLKLKSSGRRAEITPVTHFHDREIATKVAEAKKEYLRENPEDQEGAAVFSGMVEFLDDEKQLQKKDRREQSERLRLVLKLTEFNERWTNYVHKLSSDRKAVEEYWHKLEDLSRKEGAEASFARSRSGILTQVATLKAFEALGLNPHLSKPSEDAYRKIDMWLENDTPIQIKTHVQGEEVVVIEADTATPLHIEAGHGSNTARVSAAAAGEVLGFCLKLDEYAKEIGQKRFRGLFVIIPKSQIDPVTGEPSQKLLRDMSAKLKGLGRLDVA